MKIFSTLLASLVVWNATAADWMQFRGPHGNGLSDETALPSKLDQTNVAWKSSLPGRGLSSPVIIGDRVFVTCSSGAKQDRLHGDHEPRIDGEIVGPNRKQASAGKTAMGDDPSSVRWEQLEL